jgi:GLPGLI family protein
MLKIVLNVSFLLLTLVATAQTSGEIFFKETVKLDIKLPEGLPEEMLARIPKSKESKKVLRFTKDVSVYSNLEKGSNDTNLEHNSDEGDTQLQIKLVQPQDVLYKNLKDNKIVDKRDLMGKDFLIKDEVKKIAWKLSADTKNILDYPCTKATAIVGKDTISAWFTTKIAVSNGPLLLGKLPGMVLEATYNSGKRTIVATKIDLKEIDETTLVAPTKGKEVTAEDYEKIEAEKRREMRENGGMIRREIRRD